MLDNNAYFGITKHLLQPLPVLYLGLGAAVANLWRGRKESRRRLLLVTVPYLALVASSVPAVVYPALGTLEWSFPPVTSRPEGVEAVVVLSGGLMEADRTRRRPELDESTLYRCLHAAELYHQGTPCPVVVTGGVLDSRSSVPPVAPLMRELLVRLGVKESDVVVESDARTTRENATETRKLLDSRGLRKVALVTEAVHMPRSLRAFRKAGVDAAPAACFHHATGFKTTLEFFTPSPVAVKDLMRVTHEWLGLAWYRVRGAI